MTSALGGIGSIRAVKPAMAAVCPNQVAIFWDFENCPPPCNITGNKVVERILSIAHGFGRITTFKAYVDVSLNCTSLRSNSLRSDLQSSGLTLVHCPHNGKKDVTDKMMIVDMLAFVIDGPITATIVIITGDRDFAYAAAVLKLRGYHIVIIAPPHYGHASLKLQAHHLFDWNKDILGGTDPVCTCDHLKAFASAASASQSNGVSLPISVISASHQTGEPSAAASSNGTIEEWEFLSVPSDEPMARATSGRCHHTSLISRPLSDGRASSLEADFEEIDAKSPTETWIDLLPSGVHEKANHEMTDSVGLRTTGVSMRPQAGTNSEGRLVFSHHAEPGTPTVSIDFETASLLSITDIGCFTPQTEISFDLELDDMSTCDVISSSSDDSDHSALSAWGSPRVHLDKGIDGCDNPTASQVNEIGNEIPASADPPLNQTDASSCVSVRVEGRLSSPECVVEETNQQTVIHVEETDLDPEPPFTSESSATFESPPTDTASLAPDPPSPTLESRRRFQSLITVFIELKTLNGDTRMHSSELASKLLERDPQVYKKAGVSRFKYFVEEAKKAGIVISPGLDDQGRARIEINPCLYLVANTSPTADSPSFSASPSGGRSSSPTAVPTQLVGPAPEPSLRADGSTTCAKALSMSTSTHSLPTSIQRFQTLITFLIERKSSSGVTRISSTEIAIELLKRDPNVYKKANVSKLKRFIEEGREAGIILCSGWDKQGNTWVEMNPKLYPDAGCSQTTQCAEPMVLSGQELVANSSRPDSAMAVEAVYLSLINCLGTKSTSYRLLYSAIGGFLKAQRPDLYKQAGVSSLSAYLEKAEKQGIVRLGRMGTSGSEWVELMPAFRNGPP